MCLALIKATKSVSSQRLHESHINVGVVVLHKHGALKRDEAGKLIEIVIEQLLAQLRRQISFGIVQKRSRVVLQRAFAASLVIHKKRFTGAQHDVARLEITIQKVVLLSA